MEKIKQLYAFHKSGTFITIQGLFLDKILFHWAEKTPKKISTKNVAFSASSLTKTTAMGITIKLVSQT